MKKRLMTSLLVACMIFVLAACGGNESNLGYDYDLSEYIEIGQYKGIEYKPTPAEKTTVDMGDSINLDYEGKLNGEAFEGGSTGGNGTDIVVGSANFIDGFEEGLVGMKIGETKDLDLRFPDDYGSEELAGKDVVFTVTINNINIIDPIETDKANLWSKYFEACEVKKYPEKEVKEVKEQYKEYYVAYAQSYGMEYKKFLENMGMTEEMIEKEAQSYAENMIAQDMALLQLARTENIEVSSEQIEKAKAEMLEEYGCADEKEFKETYGQSFDSKEIKKSLEVTALLKDVMQYIYDSAKAV